MHGSTDEHSTAGPSVNVVKFLVAVPGTEKERQDRILRCEEEDDRELG